MTVFVVMFEGVDEANCEGVFATYELAQAWLDRKNKTTGWGSYMSIYEWPVLESLE